MTETVDEIIAKAIAGDGWRTGTIRYGYGPYESADPLNNGYRFEAREAIEALASAGFAIVPMEPEAELTVAERDDVERAIAQSAIDPIKKGNAFMDRALKKKP